MNSLIGNVAVTPSEIRRNRGYHCDLPEATPFYEALRLEDDLKRAGIAAKWWVVNQSLYGTNTVSPLLTAKAASEVEWLNRIDEHADGKFALIA